MFYIFVSDYTKASTDHYIFIQEASKSKHANYLCLVFKTEQTPHTELHYLHQGGYVSVLFVGLFVSRIMEK